MRYDGYRYLWPPRPEKSAPPALIHFYERRGWVAQVKKNGTCTVVFSCADVVTFKTRHDEDHKAWQPLPEHHSFFAGRTGWNVYVGELLHSKGPHLKNHLYLFDILVSDGVELIGKSFVARQDILQARFPTAVTDITGSRAGIGARRITEHISHASLVNPAKTWARLGDLDEGVVFKDPRALLQPCVAQTANGSWQVKIRRPHTNYSF